MQLSGLLHGEKLLRFVNFPVPEVLGPDATEAEIKAMLDRHGMVFVKPIFKGAVGKKGKAGLVGKARDLKTALAERERLYFVQHTHGNVTAKAQGVTFEAAVPAERRLQIEQDIYGHIDAAVDVVRERLKDRDVLRVEDVWPVLKDSLYGLEGPADVAIAKEILQAVLQDVHRARASELVEAALGILAALPPSDARRSMESLFRFVLTRSQ